MTSATSSGRTQCTRLSTSGEPKRLLRGGGTSSGIFRSQRLQPAPQPLELRLVDAGADAAGIDQLAVGIVVGEQQGAEIRPRAFGIGPADHEGETKPQQFCRFQELGEVARDSIMD